MGDIRELVEQLYAALDEQDVTPFLELCAPDASVEYPAGGQLPYGGTWQGLDGIRQFLEAHDEAEEILVFEPTDIATVDDTAYVRGRFQGRAKPNGSVWSTEFLHVLTTEDGRLTRWQAFFDTAAARDAHAETGASGDLQSSRG